MQNHRRPSLAIAAAVAAVAVQAYGANAISTWTGGASATSPVTGNWDVTTNWATAPSSGQDTELVFGGNTAYVSTNNLGTFALNRLLLSPSNASGTVVTGGTLSFTTNSDSAGPEIVNAATANAFTISSAISAGTNLKITGSSAVAMTISGAITSSSQLIQETVGSLTLSAANSNFTGELVVNRGMLTVITHGALAAATKYTLNGYCGTSALDYGGGTLKVGSGASQTSLPDRLADNAAMVLNGGHFNNAGQGLSGVVLGGTVLDRLGTLTFNSGMSGVTLSAGGTLNTTATTLQLTHANSGMVRTAGATGVLRGTNLGALNTARMNSLILVDNGISAFLKGSGGTGVQQSIIPWLVADNANANAANPLEWVTYDGPNGLRGLQGSEYTTVSSWGTTDYSAHNVISNQTLGVGATKTINSLMRSSSASMNIGTGSTLTVSSGAVGFKNNGSALGINADAAAGTLAFGAAEGVIWALGANINTIGSVITGSGGLTKTGSGTLVLKGENLYSGLTTVASGMLQVENSSQLGDGDVRVASGALLKLVTVDAIPDDAEVFLDAYGLFDGKIEIGAGLTETVRALWIGNQYADAGIYTATSFGGKFITGGTLEVLETGMIPEPTASGFVAAGALSTLALRRRKH